MRFELKSPVKTIEDFIKRFTPSRLTSGSNSSSTSSLVTNRSSTRGCSSALSSPSAESTLTKLDEEGSRLGGAGLLADFSPVPPGYEGPTAKGGAGGVGVSGGAELRYEAESPDEAALVYAARAYKCSLVGRLPDQVTVELPHLGKLGFELLHTLGFDSTRKRMSVVVRHPLTDQITVYTKGADSAIMELIKPPLTGRNLLCTVSVSHTHPDSLLCTGSLSLTLTPTPFSAMLSHTLTLSAPVLPHSIAPLSTPLSLPNPYPGEVSPTSVSPSFSPTSIPLSHTS